MKFSNHLLYEENIILHTSESFKRPSLEGQTNDQAEDVFEFEKASLCYPSMTNFLM